MEDYKEACCKIEIPIVKRIRIALESARENATELLNLHESHNGRTTKKNKTIAELYESEISELDFLLEMTFKYFG